jgi:hypothetical protein
MIDVEINNEAGHGETQGSVYGMEEGCIPPG